MCELQEKFELLSEIVDQGTLYFMFKMMKDRHGWGREKFSCELKHLWKSGMTGLSTYDANAGKFTDIHFDQVDFENDDLKIIDVFAAEETIDEYNRIWPYFLCD